MRLPIISLAVFAVWFVLPGCTNAKSLPSDEPEIFLLFSIEDDLYTLRNQTDKRLVSHVEIKNNNNYFETHYFNNDFTFNCANKNIYVLKSDPIGDDNKVNRCLDVIRYNGNNKFERINHVKNIFDNAKSIASDWTTEMLYWIEADDNNKYSIKSITQSFIKPEYIINPQNDTEMERLHVYPKAGELYFLSRGSLWYTSNKPNSTVKLVLGSSPKIDYITDFSIDYATDKLYYIAKINGDFVLHCIDIEISSRLSKEGIVYRFETLATAPNQAMNLVALNNTFYWTTVESEKVDLYFKNGNKAVISLIGLSENSKLSFVSSKCPHSTDKIRKEEYHLIERENK